VRDADGDRERLSEELALSDCERESDSVVDCGCVTVSVLEVLSDEESV